MHYLNTVFKAIFLCVIFVCATNGRNLESRRVRRQNADVKATEYFARLALERMPTDCLQIGCGLVDLKESGKKKRTDTQSSPYHKQRLLKIVQLLIPKEQ